MFKRYGLFIVAFGLAVASQSFSQQLTEEAVDQQAESDRQEQSQGGTAPPGIPVRILEDPEQAERSERKQREAEQREIEDLHAQNLAAQSAHRAVLVGAAQTILAFFGTLALLYSLYLNRKATKAAVEAVDIAGKVGRAQTRAYIGIKKTSLSVSSGKISGSITFANFGQSTAKDVHCRLMWACEPGDFDPNWLNEVIPSTAVGSIAPTGELLRSFATDGSTDPARSMTPEQIEDLIHARAIFWLYGDVTYTDAFDRPQFTKFRFWLTDLNGGYAFAYCEDGNDAS